MITCEYCKHSVDWHDVEGCGKILDDVKGHKYCDCVKGSNDIYESRLSDLQAVADKLYEALKDYKKLGIPEHAEALSAYEKLMEQK